MWRMVYLRIAVGWLADDHVWCQLSQLPGGATYFGLLVILHLMKWTIFGPASFLAPAPSSRSRSIPSQPYLSGQVATSAAISSAPCLEVSQSQGLGSRE